MPLPANNSDDADPQSGAGDHRRVRRWPFFDAPAIRCILSQAVVNAVLMKVADVFAHQPTEVLLIQWNHQIQQLFSAAPQPQAPVLAALPAGQILLPLSTIKRSSGPRTCTREYSTDRWRTFSNSRTLPDQGCRSR